MKHWCFAQKNHLFSHSPSLFTPPTHPSSHLKLKFTSVQFLLCCPQHLLFSQQLGSAAFEIRGIHLVIARYQGCGCMAASTLSLALELTGSHTGPAHDAEQLKRKSFSIGFILHQLKIWRQFFKGSNEKRNGKKERSCRAAVFSREVV